tara:strand:+ start:4138 stop:4293 length:156 start_codon:yes stop_codon:yes gene_type:complete
MACRGRNIGAEQRIFTGHLPLVFTDEMIVWLQDVRQAIETTTGPGMAKVLL